MTNKENFELNEEKNKKEERPSKGLEEKDTKPNKNKQSEKILKKDKSSRLRKTSQEKDETVGREENKNPVLALQMDSESLQQNLAQLIHKLPEAHPELKNPQFIQALENQMKNALQLFQMQAERLKELEEISDEEVEEYEENVEDLQEDDHSQPERKTSIKKPQKDESIDTEGTKSERASTTSTSEKKGNSSATTLEEAIKNLFNFPGKIMEIRSGEGLVNEMNMEDFMSEHVQGMQAEEESELPQNLRTGHRRKQRYLKLYGTNLNQLALENKIDKLVGRDEELHRVIQILNRRSKNNPVLLGEPGVGKTALAEGLALRIVQGEVPQKLKNMEVYLVDLTALVAGTQFRGQFEARLKGLIDEAISLKNVILVIDELHNIVGAGTSDGGSMNAANILKPALAKGQIRILGSTTLKEYRKFIEKDNALERRFQVVQLQEPSAAETIEILKGVRNYYETYHNVTFSDQVIVELVRLADRYVTDRNFPDKAIDILDEAGSKSNLDQVLLIRSAELEMEIEDLEADLEELEKEVAQSDFKDLELLKTQAEEKEKLALLKEEYENLQDKLKPREITVEEIARVVEMWTGIPVASLTEEEKEKLLHLEERLHKHIIGQEKAVNKLSRSVCRTRSGFSKKNKPVSFLFVGPTGVGKTALVKALAKELFGDEKAMIRFDMSEFMEAHSVSKWIGSPPGYVGFEEAGQLTEQVRRRPYSVLLLDEIEKAHKDVYNMLLQILDEGRLTDSQGRVINFEHTIIIMTSNAGTSLKSVQFGFGNRGQVALENQIHQELKVLFRPEFLNRLDDIVIFNALSKEDQSQILDMMLEELSVEVKEHGLQLHVSPEAKSYLLEKGYSDVLGARPLRRCLAVEVEDLLAQAYLKDEMNGACAVLLVKDKDSDKLSLKFTYETQVQ